LYWGEGYDGEGFQRTMRVDEGKVVAGGIGGEKKRRERDDAPDREI